MAKVKNGFSMRIKLTLTSEQLGTIPKTQEIVDSYLKTRAKGKETKDEFASPLSDEDVSEREKKAWTGFMEKDGRVFVMDYFIKGYIKNAGNNLKNGIIPIKNLRSKIDDFVFVEPRNIFFEGIKNEKPLERPIRVQTAQGPRVSLIKSDEMMIGSTLEFDVSVPIPCEIQPSDIDLMFQYGYFMGVGQWRNGGYGKFSYELIDAIEKPYFERREINLRQAKSLGAF